ncbi:MAG: FecR family protein [Sediminibacterium sp.]|nr:FecR family protein [Sediminibacterium sp.]
MDKHTEQYFYDLLSLKLAGDATEQQLTDLEEILAIEPSFRFLHDQMMLPAGSREEDELQTQQAYAGHSVRIQLEKDFEEQTASLQTAQFSQDTSGFSLRKMFFAGLVAASFLGFFVYQYYSSEVSGGNKKGFSNEVITQKGSKSYIKLPDGTGVWLNTDSKLTYAENFSGNTREVMLTGEAYFDVAHDPAHPFIIHTGKINIKVLGTAFNVRNYPQDKALETSLMRGKIEVSVNNRPGEIIVMKPLEKLIISKDSSYTSEQSAKQVANEPTNKVVLTSVTYVQKDSLVAETSWLNNKMAFINEPLENIAQEIERKYDVTVVFNNPKARNYRYTGVFDNVSLQKVFEIIKYSKNINYRIVDKTLIIE